MDSLVLIVFIKPLCICGGSVGVGLCVYYVGVLEIFVCVCVC